jgi:type II secretory pathway pseudopilin PulG
MAALAIMSIALVAVMQLFSSSLRATARNEEVTISMLHARSLLEEACAPGPSPMDFEGTLMLDGGLEADRQVVAIDVEDEPVLYEISITVERPTGGTVVLKCQRAYYEGDK